MWIALAAVSMTTASEAKPSQSWKTATAKVPLNDVRVGDWAEYEFKSTRKDYMSSTRKRSRREVWVVTKVTDAAIQLEIRRPFETLYASLPRTKTLPAEAFYAIVDKGLLGAADPRGRPRAHVPKAKERKGTCKVSAKKGRRTIKLRRRGKGFDTRCELKLDTARGLLGLVDGRFHHTTRFKTMKSRNARSCALLRSGKAGETPPAPPIDDPPKLAKLVLDTDPFADLKPGGTATFKVRLTTVRPIGGKTVRRARIEVTVTRSRTLRFKQVGGEEVSARKQYTVSLPSHLEKARRPYLYAVSLLPMITPGTGLPIQSASCSQAGTRFTATIQRKRKLQRERLKVVLDTASPVGFRAASIKLVNLKGSWDEVSLELD